MKREEARLATKTTSLRRNFGLLALEPRIMFDGAAVATADAVVADASAYALISDVPAAVEVRAADPAKDGGKKEVVFVDTSVADYKTLEAGIKDGVGIIEIDGSQDGLAQIAKWASSQTGYDSISILSHGSEATLHLGSNTVTEASLSSAATQVELATIGKALTADGDLLLYGCDIAQGNDGTQFIADLAKATGADVAASTDPTGAAAKGGDWVLEKETGQIDAPAMLNDSGMAGFSGLLATVTFVEGSAEDLNIESGATSFARTIDGATFTFANGSSAYAGSYFDIQTMNGIPGDGFAGVYALSARNAGGGVDFTITVQSGYTFDLTGFTALAETNTILVYYNGMTSNEGFTLDGAYSPTTRSSLTGFNDVTSVTFSSENYALFQGLIITDVKAPPTLSTPSTIIYTDTTAANTFSNQTGTLTASVSAVTSSPIASYGIFGGTSGGSTDISGTLYDVSQAGTYGTLYVKSIDGSYVYVPNATAINATSSAQSETFTVTATDNAAATSTATLMVSITGANDTPAITSGATATVAENSTGTVYTATASDADAGQTLSYSLGGTDASLFNINSSTGAVSFKVAPNYEVPSDSGGNNVYDINVIATDNGSGALSASKAVAITVTNVVEVPTTTVSSAALSADTGSSLTDFTTNTPSQTISGTLTANLASGEKVQVSYDNGGSWSDATSYTVGSNSWSTTTTLSGSNTFQARVSNADGSGTAYTHGYTLDTTAPTTTVSTASFSADTGSSNTDLITTTAAQTISGTLSANLVSGESVYVSLDNGSTWTAATATAGSSAWSLTGQTLTASSTLRVKVQDEAGNDGVVYSQAYVFDTTAPTTTVATASFSADTGSSSTDFNTSTAAQTISGTLSANLANGETVYVSLDNGSTWTAATASVGSNAWSLAGQTLTASSTLKIKVTDAAGNDGSVFSQAYLLDTTAPTITFGTIRFSADTGSSNSDLVTSTAAQTITATLSAAPAGSDVVYGSLDNGSTWTDITTKVSGTTLSWNGVTLAGSDTLLLRVVDAAGNVSASTSQAYTLDTTAPPAPGTPVLDSASDTGISNSDRITSDTTPTFTGSADNGTTVSVYDGATLLGTTVAGASGWSFTSGVLGSGSHTITAVATDAAGNASSASSPLSITIDTTAPATSSVTVPASGTYYVGNALDFTVNFNEAIVVNTSDGTPRIAMVVGATTRYADYISGSGTSGLVFRYVVPSGDTDSDGITLGALAANGGSFKDAAGNDAAITLNSVGSTASINVDGSQPSVTGVSASSADGAYREGQTITLTVGFSSAVTVDTTGGTPTLALGSGGIATYSAGSGSSTLSFSYVIGAGQNSADLDYSSTAALALNGATIIETGGSHQTASLALATPGTAGSLGANNDLVIDTTAPAVSAPVLATASDSGTSNSDHITNVTTPTITGTAEAASTVLLYDTDGTTVLGSTTATGGSWSITSSALSAGSHTLTVKATDAAGNMSAASTGLSVTIDTTASAVSAPVLAAASDSGTSSSDRLTNVTTPTITGTAEVGSSVTLYDTNGTTVLGTATADGSGNWSMTSSTLASGSHTLTAKATDAAGNTSAVSSALTVTIDTVAPGAPSAPVLATASDSGASSSDRLTNATTPTLTGTAEANATVMLYDTDGTTVLGTATADGAGNWSIVSSALGNGVHTLTAKATDAAGNISAASTGLAVTIDTAAPAVSAPVLATGSDSGTSSSDRLTNVTTPTITGTAEIGSLVTLYDTNGTTVLGTATANGSGNWSITSSALADGSHTLTATATDAAGNTSAVSSGLVVTIDTATPTATIVMADTELIAGETSQVTITFSEAVSGFDNNDLTVANGTLSAVSSSDGGKTWTATFTPTANLTSAANLISLNNTGVADQAGNTAAGTTSSASYAIDTLRPTATIVMADTALAVGETSQVTITFSEAVSGFDNSDLTVANGTLSAVSSSDGGTTWTATFTPTANLTSAANLITLNGAGVHDVAGNAVAGAISSASYAIDTLRPTATIVMADTALAVGETSQVTITFSEAVSGFDNSDLTVANGTLSAVSSSDGGRTWTATFTPTANLTSAANLISLNNTGVADLAGNAGVGTTNSASYAIDTLPPQPTTLALVGSPTLAADSVQYTVSFSEDVTGVDVQDFSIVTSTGVVASITSVTALDARTYLVTLGNISGTGSLQLNLVNSGTGILDAAGNPLSIGLSGTLHQVDTSAFVLPVEVPVVATPVVVSQPPSPSVPMAPVVITALDLAPGLALPSQVLSPATPLSIASILQASGVSNVLGMETPASSATRQPFLSVSSSAASDLQAIPDLGAQNLRSDQSFSYALPATTFVSSDPAARISVEVRQSNGEPLPSWLKFDPVTGVLSGKPPADWVRSLKLEIVARDGKGHQASSAIELDFGRGERTPPLRPGALFDRLLPTPVPAGRAGLNAQFAQFGSHAHLAERAALQAHLREAAHVAIPAMQKES